MYPPNVPPVVDDPSVTDVNVRDVRVVDIRMPFWSMVVFMVKWALAAIPAIIVVIAVISIVVGILGTSRCTYSTWPERVGAQGTTMDTPFNQ